MIFYVDLTKTSIDSLMFYTIAELLTVLNFCHYVFNVSPPPSDSVEMPKILSILV